MIFELHDRERPATSNPDVGGRDFARIASLLMLCGLVTGCETMPGKGASLPSSLNSTSNALRNLGTQISQSISTGSESGNQSQTQRSPPSSTPTSVAPNRRRPTAYNASFNLEQGQVWSGRTRCNGAEIPMRVSIESVEDLNETGRVLKSYAVNALFELGSQEKPEAAARFTGKYTDQIRHLEFFKAKWTVWPSYSPFNGISGSISRDGLVFEGNVTAFGCEKFSLSTDSTVTARLIQEGATGAAAMVAARKANQPKMPPPGQSQWYSAKTGEDLQCGVSRKKEDDAGKVRHYCLVSGNYGWSESQQVWEEAIDRKAPVSPGREGYAKIYGTRGSNADPTGVEMDSARAFPGEVAEVCSAGNERACYVLSVASKTSFGNYVGGGTLDWTQRDRALVKKTMRGKCPALTDAKNTYCVAYFSLDFSDGQLHGFPKEHPRWCLIDKALYSRFRECEIQGNGAKSCGEVQSDLDSYELVNNCPYPVRFNLQGMIFSDQQSLRPGEKASAGKYSQILWVIRDK